MRTNRRGYLMAMLSGVAIVGAATVGVTTATAQQNEQVAAEIAAPATVSSVPTDISSPLSIVASSAPKAAGTTVGSAASATQRTTAATPAGSTAGSTARASSAVAGSKPSSGAVSAVTTAAPTTAAPTTAAPTTAPPATAAPTSAAPTTAVAPAAQFKDGQYTATGSYNSPGGEQQIGVTVTVAADIVTAASVQLQATGIAKSYQTLFQSGYQAQVVGKSLASIKLGAVAGSSLTGEGFNKALADIETQAHA